MIVIREKALKHVFSGQRDYTPAAEALIEARIEARGSSRCGHTWTDVLPSTHK